MPEIDGSKVTVGRTLMTHHDIDSSRRHKMLTYIRERTERGIAAKSGVRMPMKKLLAISICFLLAVACATPGYKKGPSAEHGFSSTFVGLAHLILSPVQIAEGLLEGMAPMSYYLSTRLI